MFVWGLLLAMYLATGLIDVDTDFEELSEIRGAAHTPD
jgi:hypothetical protein